VSRPCRTPFAVPFHEFLKRRIWFFVSDRTDLAGMAKISQDEGYRTKFLISFLCIFSVSHFIVSFIQPVDDMNEKKDAKKTRLQIYFLFTPSPFTLRIELLIIG
jgi:hypothetical protein